MVRTVPRMTSSSFTTVILINRGTRAAGQGLSWPAVFAVTMDGANLISESLVTGICLKAMLHLLYCVQGSRILEEGSCIGSGSARLTDHAVRKADRHIQDGMADNGGLHAENLP